MFLGFCASAYCYLPRTRNTKPMKLFDMAISADKIAYGTIVKVEELFFYLAEQNGSKIKIAKYNGIAGSGSYRWAKYEEGQRVLVFLRKRNMPLS